MDQILFEEVGFDDVVIHGGQKGADKLADKWAVEHDRRVVEFKAHWDKYGKAAGPMRNARMLERGKPDLVVAFPGGVGTANMIKQAREAKVPVLRIKLHRDGSGSYVIIKLGRTKRYKT